MAAIGEGSVFQTFEQALENFQQHSLSSEAMYELALHTEPYQIIKVWPWSDRQVCRIILLREAIFFDQTKDPQTLAKYYRALAERMDPFPTVEIFNLHGGKQMTREELEEHAAKLLS